MHINNNKYYNDIFYKMNDIIIVSVTKYEGK